MDALLSGQAAVVAILAKEIQLRPFGRPPLFSNSEDDIRLAFSACSDVSSIKISNLDEADAAGQKAWRQDRALRLFLLLIDKLEPEEFLSEYATCLENLIVDADVKTFVERAMYVAELSAIDKEKIEPAVRNCPRTSAFLTDLLKHQSEIKKVREAFERLPLDVFDSDDARWRFFEKASVIGANYELVKALKAGQKVDFVVLKLLAQLRHLEGSRKAVEAWTSGMRANRISRQKIEEEVLDEFLPDLASVTGQGGRQIHENIKRQQAGIIERLKDRDLAEARRYADELIRQQAVISNSDQIGKSLSNLSHSAKELGVPELQLEWAERAVEENPADPITFAHLADALIGMNRFLEASAAIDKIESLGDKFSAATNRARILRATGKPNEARNLYLSANAEFSNDPNVWRARIGAAEALRDMGKYGDALTEYSKLTEDFPLEAAVWAGLASVLMDLGRFSEAITTFGKAQTHSKETIGKNGRATAYKLAGEFSKALRLYDEILEEFPNDAVALSGRAEVFRVQGDLARALAAYDDAVERSPFVAMPIVGKAQVLKELGRFNDAGRLLENALERFPYAQNMASAYGAVLATQGLFAEALSFYDDAIRRFPYDAYLQKLRGDAIRRLNRPHDALAAYDAVLKSHQEFTQARLAKAALLIELGDLNAADQLLPAVTQPKSQSDWNLYFLRTQVVKKSGKIQECRNLLYEGVRKVPFVRQRRLFKAALARFELEDGHASIALKVVEAAPDEISNVIRFHALAASGRINPARKAFDEIRSSEAGIPYLELSEEIARRFKIIEGNPTQSREWIFESENRHLLLEAA